MHFQIRRILESRFWSLRSRTNYRSSAGLRRSLAGTARETHGARKKNGSSVDDCLLPLPAKENCVSTFTLGGSFPTSRSFPHADDRRSYNVSSLLCRASNITLFSCPKSSFRPVSAYAARICHWSGWIHRQ